MVIAFLLAQLVLPGPLSGPIQPPGMICASGSCERGPMVYRTSASRSRLVVACDMRSDTCSDGRKITTTRATPVPCEVAPGVWEMVGVDEGCYSVRGLESWAANTSYLSWGAELDRSPWRVVEGATLAKQDGFYRISGVNTNSRVLQSIALPEAGVWTLSCIMRTSGSQNPRLRINQEGASGGGFCNLDSSDEFSTYSCTQTVTGTPTALAIHVYTGIGHIDVQGCWLTRTDTPGRPCWGGEAPVTCAADRHTISTEGWPTESGEACITVIFREILSWNTLIRSPASGLRLEVRSSGALVLSNITPTSLQIPAPRPVEGVPHVYCVGRSGSEVYLKKDGVKLVSEVRDAFYWGSVTEIGVSGSIRSLRVRSFE